jgi:hypothetical protein
MKHVLMFALMRKLRSLHLYLGCVFAPMLLFFAISGIWQTLGVEYHSGLLTFLSTLHKSTRLKSGATLTSSIMRYFILAMAGGFIVTTIIGIVMALTQGGNRKTAFCCLAFGVVFPLVAVLVTAHVR